MTARIRIESAAFGGITHRNRVCGTLRAVLEATSSLRRGEPGSVQQGRKSLKMRSKKRGMMGEVTGE